jgi:hypothetical protein
VVGNHSGAGWPGFRRRKAQLPTARRVWVQVFSLSASAVTAVLVPEQQSLALCSAGGPPCPPAPPFPQGQGC